MRIYALMWGALVLYVGKTKHPLGWRAMQHRGQHNRTYAKYIPGYMNWEIKLLEECPDEQGKAQERFWYDTLMPLYNHVRPSITKEEKRADQVKYRASKQ